jgi:hypothetical protein
MCWSLGHSSSSSSGSSDGSGGDDVLWCGDVTLWRVLLLIDWWVLGVLIYNLLLGLTPWDGESYDEQLRQIQNGDVLWPPAGMVSGDMLVFWAQQQQQQW